MSWTDARIDHELVDAFALTGGDVDSPTFRAVYNRMIGLRDDLAACLAAAQQRIAELEVKSLNSAYDGMRQWEKKYIHQWMPVDNWRHKGHRGVDPYWIELDGQKLRLTDAYGVFTVELPDGYTICRRRQAQEGAEG